MIPQVKKMIDYIVKLPEPEQIRIAEMVLEEQEPEGERSAQGKAFIEYLIEKTKVDARENRGMPLEEFFLSTTDRKPCGV